MRLNINDMLFQKFNVSLYPFLQIKPENRNCCTFQILFYCCENNESTPNCPKWKLYANNDGPHASTINNIPSIVLIVRLQFFLLLFIYNYSIDHISARPYTRTNSTSLNLTFSIAVFHDCNCGWDANDESYTVIGYLLVVVRCSLLLCAAEGDSVIKY